MRSDGRVHCHSRTDVGVRRSHNQDAYRTGIAPNRQAFRRRGHLFVVADGMGAHAVGELASKLAVDTITLSYSKSKITSADDALRRAIVEANATIFEKGNLNQEFRGMGTTATVLLLNTDGARIGHVGDSRCYRIREDRIDQLSFDHSLLWETARRQNIQPEEVRAVPKNIIIRSLGPEATVNVDVNGPYPVEEGDRFILCTDGLSGQVSDREIWAAVNYLPLEEATDFLVHLSNYRGGIDNVTVIVVQVGERPEPGTKTRSNLMKSLSRAVRKIYGMLPWSSWLLLLSSILGVSALALGYSGSSLGWSLGVLALLAALPSVAWFGFLDVRRRLKMEPKPTEAPPIYTSQQFSLQATLVEKMAKNEEYLRSVAAEQDWPIDEARLADFRMSGEKNLQTGDLTNAFRDYCRALCVLFAGMRDSRQKHEVFDPHWQTDSV